MSVALRKVDGVRDVKVSLNEGWADVTLKPANRVTLEAVRNVVRRNGFTPKAADVRVVGRVTEREGKPALAVTGLDLVYDLAEHPQATGKLAELRRAVGDGEVTVSGQVPETPPAWAVKAAEGQRPPALLVRAFTLPE